MRIHPRMILLALGALGGFGFGFHSLHHHVEGRDEFERHVAQVCVDAAQTAKTPR